MISPIIAATTSTPVASIQQNTEAQSIINSNVATVKVKEEERQVREAVVNKDEAVFYQPKHDAKEEGKNKYMYLYGDKKKKKSSNDSKDVSETKRVNFDIKL